MENKFDGKWLICFEFKEMRIIITLDNKIEQFSCTCHFENSVPGRPTYLGCKNERICNTCVCHGLV